MVEAGRGRRWGGAGASPSVCYVLEAFPVLSQTFVWNEILGVREAGASATVAYLNRVQPEQPDARVEALLAEAVNLGTWIGRGERWRNRVALAARGRTRARLARAGVFRADARAVSIAERLAVHVLRSGAAHIHAHFGGAASRMAMAASALTGVPFSFTMHGYDIHFHPPDDLALQCKRAACVITVSEANRDFLVERHGLPAEKVKVVHNGIRVEDFAGRPALPAAGTTRLLTVARLHPVKGLDVMLHSLATLRDLDWQWTVVGDGGECDALAALSKQLGVADRVRLAGARAHHELPAVYRDADVFVLPSRSEGLPVVLMEAMASGLPIVATTVGGVGEIVAEGASGHLVAPDDPAALASALRQVMSDPAQAMRMGEANRAKALQAFSIRQQAQALLALWFPARASAAGRT